jgi:hypothetical protein
MSLSGFLFLFILTTFLTSGAFFYKYGEVNSDDRLQKINNDPKKFKISIMLLLISSISVLALTVMLFIVFSPYNLILGVIWTIFRIGEGLILIYNEKTSWGLINIAGQYSSSSGSKKDSLSDSGRSIFQTLNSRFILSQFLFGIGTLTYSIVFVTYGVVPEIIGGLGLVASILVILGNGTQLAERSFKSLNLFGGLLMILFEVIFGGWLLFTPLI